jgi:hypothetical protein
MNLLEFEEAKHDSCHELVMPNVESVFLAPLSSPFYPHRKSRFFLCKELLHA